MTAQGAPAQAADPPTAAQAFQQLWVTLSEFIGSAATATLLRRSQKLLAAREPAIEELQIERAGVEYRYAVPVAWLKPEESSLAQLHELVSELCPLLVQLTGNVVLRRLAANRELARFGISFTRSHE